MQEQISDDATDTETSEPARAAPVAERERADTTYVILIKTGTTAWEILANALHARSTREALQTYVETLAEKPKDGTVLVAVASRSWKPVPVGIRTETITRVVIGE